MRDNLACMSEEHASATQIATAHADVIEIFAEVLAKSEEEVSRRRLLQPSLRGHHAVHGAAAGRDLPLRLDPPADHRGWVLRRRARAVHGRLLQSRVGAGARARCAGGGSGAQRSARTLSPPTARRVRRERLRAANRRSARRSRRAGAGWERSLAIAAATGRHHEPRSAEVLGITSGRWPRSRRWRGRRRASTVSARWRSKDVSTLPARCTRAWRAAAVRGHRSPSPATSRSTRRHGAGCAEEVQEALSDLRAAMAAPAGALGGSDTDHARGGGGAPAARVSGARDRGRRR